MLSTASIVNVGAGPDGFWLVSTADDRLGGVFSSRKAALAFAREEARMLNPVRIVISDAGPDRQDG